MFVIKEGVMLKYICDYCGGFFHGHEVIVSGPGGTVKNIISL